MRESAHSRGDGPMQELSNNLSELKIHLSPSNPVSNIPTATELPSFTTTPDIPPHRSHDPNTSTKRTSPFQFGQRYLEPTDDVFSYNAWDHVIPDPAHHTYCEQQYTTQRLHPVSPFDASRFNITPSKWWDLFYKQKSTTFFKDRKWLRQEFPVLDSVAQVGAGRKVVLEVGAGAGNTAFPIVRGNQNPELVVHAVDFSKGAVETMRGSREYGGNEIGRVGVLRADVWDVADEGGGDGENEGLPPGLSEGSVDVVIMIFIFSALSPKQWEQAVRNIYRVLKPGGEVLFRDYGRGDLAQVRFKAGRWMEENFYVRGDGTRVYFFEKDELVKIWGGWGTEDNATRTPRLDIVNLEVDRRLIVNRQKKIKMYRCWIQGRFRKPREPSTAMHQPSPNAE